MKLHQVRDDDVVVHAVIGLVGVDEREIDLLIGGDRRQRLRRRRDHEIDPVGHPGSLPVLACDRSGAGECGIGCGSD